MKKILITRRLLRLCEEKASKIFNTKLNTNDELYSQKKLIELSQGCDGILTSITDKIDRETINKLPDTIKIISRDPSPPPISYIKQSGGMFLDMTIHDFDMVKYLSGSEISEWKDKAKNIIVLKRSMSTGFSGIDNELFYLEKTSMLFGDAKDSLEAISKELKSD